MAKRRRFILEFKAEVVIEALRGESSQAELCRRHNLSEEQLSKRKYQFLENTAFSIDISPLRGVKRHLSSKNLCLNVQTY